MVLRNYYNMLAAWTMGVRSTDVSNFGDGHINFKDIYGTLYGWYAITKGSYGFKEAPSFGNIGFGDNQTFLRLGTGNTAVTYDDYKLDNDVTSNVTISTYQQGTPTFNSSTGKWTNTCTCLLTNSSSSSITIKEVGLTEYMTNTYNQGATYVLVYREVLSTPFTLAAGESVTYTQNLEFTMPTV